ncbi:MAG: sulfonate ABC transporter [Candidatus Korarchaeota archaeon]|nr:sulfonate ABC transporter [Candidatus Korarchaeota archaeon]
MKAQCPVCGADVVLPEDVMAGELLECSSCGATLEVYEQDSVFLLKEAEEIGEDWGE